MRQNASKLLAIIICFAFVLLACGCESGNTMVEVSASESETSSADASLDTSTYVSKTLIIKPGDAVTTDSYIWKFTEARIFDESNYYGYFRHAPDSDSVYIALYFDMENTTDSLLNGIIFFYNMKMYSSAYVYNNGYVLINGCGAIDESEYTSSNPRFTPHIPARAKAKGCFAWVIPKEWTDFEFIYENKIDTYKFYVSKTDISKTSERV